MLDFDTIRQKLQSSLSIWRYIHTIGVAKEAKKLAAHYGVDQDKAEAAALLHDCAKDYTDDMKRRFCKEYHVPIDEVMEKKIDLVHSFLGAEVAKREFGVEDDEILDAIRYHTTGKREMTPLSKIIFVADYIEPGRKAFEGLEKARELAYQDLDAAVKLILEDTIDYVEKNGNPLHPLSLEALDYYRKMQGGVL